MSEPGQVRLVRCPNCKKLLPELTDYSVYQCGGCGIVLRVKDKNFEVDVVSGNFNLLENGTRFLGDGSIDDCRSYGSSASMSESMGIPSEMDENRVYSSMGKGDRRIMEYEERMTENITGISKDYRDSRSGVGFVTGSQISDRVMDWRSGDRGGKEHFRSMYREEVGRVRYSASMHSDEGPSERGRNYDYVESAKFAKNISDLDELKKIVYAEQERADILRKLDELKYQLSRIDVDSKPKEKGPTARQVFHQDPYSNPEIRFSDGSLGQKKISMQYSGADKHLAGGPSYNSHYKEPPSFMDSREMAMHKFYPPMHTPNQVQEFEDPFMPSIPRRPSYRVSPHLQDHHPHPTYSAQYMNSDIGKMTTPKPYTYNIKMHSPSCLCVQCYNKHPQVLPPVASVHRDRSYLDDSNDPNLYSRENLSVLGPHYYNPQFTNLPLQSNGSSQWPKVQNLEAGVSNHQRHPKVVLYSGGRRYCPIAGGAPFIACCSCSELLRLPKELLMTERSQKKMRCAACSKLVILAVIDKKLVISSYEEAKGSPRKVDDNSYMATKYSPKFGANSGNMDFSSDEYDNSGFDIHLASASPEKGLSYNQSSGVRSVHSPSSCASENEDSKNTTSSTCGESKSAELRTGIPPRPPSGSPLRDHIDYSTKYTMANPSEKGSKIDQHEQEIIVSTKVMSQQNSVKDSAAATELDISSNEYFNTGTSTDSADISREENQTRAKKGSPFFAGIIRKSYNDRSVNNVEEEVATVRVNGHPIPDRLVKNAEKFAGRIQPGEYWYDSRAGFWGVIGGPCLGIIPPSIEEFNIPMPENCAGGNTSVFVNGRELHQKDLSLLGKRGLPTDSNRSYIIEISGRVLDEDSGEELDSLGKLAPTVEKTKHGFGMRTPRARAA